MSFQDYEWGAAAAVPQVQGLVFLGPREDSSIGQGQGAFNPTGMSFEGDERVTAVAVPHAQGVVPQRP